MLEKSKIDRINELAKKHKTQGLNEQETQERDVLRKEYLSNLRSHVGAMVENIHIQEENGDITPVRKKQERQGDQ